MTIREELILMGIGYLKMIISILPFLPILIFWQWAVIKASENEK